MLDLERMQGFDIHEFIRCNESFEYFVKKYILPSKEGGIAELTEYQTHLLPILCEYPRIVHNTPERQTGQSVLAYGYIIWTIIFKPYSNVIMSEMIPARSTYAIQYIRNLLDKIPTWMQPKQTDKLKNSIKFDNDSRLLSMAKLRPGDMKGRCITLLYVDYSTIDFPEWLLEETYHLRNMQFIALSSGKYNV